MQRTVFPNRSFTSDSRVRRGFTLIELLVVLTVMIILAAMMTYALASAQTDARIKRTQADLLSIWQLLQTRVSEISLSKMNRTRNGCRSCLCEIVCLSSLSFCPPDPIILLTKDPLLIYIKILPGYWDKGIMSLDHWKPRTLVPNLDQLPRRRFINTEFLIPGL